MKHWMSSYDPDDGTEQSVLCECGIAENHNVREYKEHLSLIRDELADWGEDDAGG